MNIRLLTLFFLLSVQASAQFTGYNMIQLGRWDDESIPYFGDQQFSACWGWYDSTKDREYAIFGSLDSHYFADVTDPTNPRIVDIEDGSGATSIWREYKTYGKYCYAVADAGPASLQIYDLSYLPDSVHKVYDSDSLVMRVHTLWIDGDRLYCNSATTKSAQTYAVTILSLANPENPSLLGHVIPPIFDGSPAFVKCHDAYVRNDTLWCSGENAGVFIYDVSDPSNGQLMGTIQDYPEKGYNHSGSLSGDGKTFVFTDENAGLGIKAYDVSDFANFELQSVFRSNPGAIAHNPYFMGSRLFVSSYHDGVYVYDLSTPTDPKIIAWYDTYPQNGTTYGGFEGVWTVYPDLPSGNIIAVDQANGLFMLRMDATASVSPLEVKDALIYPNPTEGRVNIGLESTLAQDLDISLVDASGKTVHQVVMNAQTGWNDYQLDLPEALPRGIYMLQLKGANTHICKKLAIR